MASAAVTIECNFEMSSLSSCVYWSAEGRLDVNVALNRPSYSASTFTDDQYGTYPPSKGNDGDKSNCHRKRASHSVTVTRPHLHPWYAVDLGVELKIAGVRLTNRADARGKSLQLHGLLSVTQEFLAASSNVRYCYRNYSVRPSVCLSVTLVTHS